MFNGCLLCPSQSPTKPFVSVVRLFFSVDTSEVKGFTLLLSPSEIDFTAPVTVILNGQESQAAIVEESTETLLKWAQSDLDRSMLFTAELVIRLE